MTALGPVLIGVGVGDLVAGGLAGDPVERPWLAALAAMLASAVATFAAAGGLVRSLVAGAATGVVSLAWLLGRRESQRLPIGLPVVALGVLTLLAAVVLPLSGAAASPLTRVLDRLDVVTDPATVLIVVGVGLALLSTANAIVRVVLDAAGPDVARSQDRLRGGRLIGAVERLIVAGLTAAGQPAAAALVVAAKAIVRFPELSSTARRDELARGGVDLDPLARVDAVTEYFLLGSLTSLAVALLAGWLIG